MSYFLFWLVVLNESGKLWPNSNRIGEICISPISTCVSLQDWQRKS